MPANTSLHVHIFLANNNFILMPQPTYSPDLATCNFFLFPKLKRPMKGQRFATIEEIKIASLEDLKAISKVLQGLEKELAQVYYICGGLL